MPFRAHRQKHVTLVFIHFDKFNLHAYMQYSRGIWSQITVTKELLPLVENHLQDNYVNQISRSLHENARGIRIP